MKRWLRLTLQLLSLALFGFILWLGGAEVWQHVLTGDRGSILVSFLLIGAATMLSATRLRSITESVAGGGLASWHHFYYLNITTRAIGLVVPRSLSTVAGKSVALRAMGIPLKRAVWIVVLDNLFDLGLLGVLVVPSLLFLRNGVSPVGFTALTVGLIVAATGALWWITITGRMLSLIKWLGRIPWLASALHLDPESAADLLPSRTTALKALGLSVLLNAAIAACFYYVAQAVGLTYSWRLFAAGFPMTQLSLVLAVTPGGLGLFDAGWYGVLLLGGVSNQDALTFVIAQRAYVFLFVLIWAGFGTLLSLATGSNRT